MSLRISRAALAALLACSPIPMLANKAAAAGHAGGMSSSHISAAGLHNSNGPNAIDRDFGQARAEDRRSAQGAGHERATANLNKHVKSKSHGKRCGDMAASK